MFSEHLQQHRKGELGNTPGTSRKTKILKRIISPQRSQRAQRKAIFIYDLGKHQGHCVFKLGKYRKIKLLLFLFSHPNILQIRMK